MHTCREGAGLPGQQMHTGQYGIRTDYAEIREWMATIIAVHVLHPFSTVLNPGYEEGLSNAPIPLPPALSRSELPSAVRH